MDLSDAFAELHVVCVVLLRVVDGGVDALERRLGAAVRKVAAVVRDEGEGGIAARKRLRKLV